jgi:hypothetical protein
MPAPRKPIGPAEVERRKSLIATHSFVGNPRTDRLIANGHHPFHPSRIVVLEKDQAHGFVDDGLFALCGRVREEVDRRMEQLKCPPFLDEKLTLLVRSADIFASHYKSPDALWAWSEGLVGRETLGSTGLGRGSGLLHQFQRVPCDSVKTDCQSVDWWALLIPSGTDFDSLDGLPVYSLIGHLFEQYNADVSGQLNVWCLASHLMRDPPPFFSTWHEFSRTDPTDATRLLNDRLFCLLEEFGR